MAKNVPGDTPKRPKGKSLLRKTPKQNRASEIVEKILSATSYLVGTHGTAKVTTSAIAAHLGIPVGTVYRYFANKESIFSALAERYHVHKDGRFSHFQEESAKFATTDEFIRTLVSSVLNHLRDEVGYVNFLKVSIHLPDHYEQNIRSAERWANAMSRLERFSDLDIPDSRKLTFFRLAMLVSITAQERVLLCEDEEEAARLEEEYKVMLSSYVQHYAKSGA
ncbi:MAG: TetR/AcrR family transcriptional regulator [Rhizobiaceae bacterium]